MSFVDRVRETIEEQATGLTILTVLRRDHREVVSLLDAVEDAANADARPRVFAKLQRALLAHLKAEETKVYWRLRRDVETEAVAMRAAEERYVLMELLDELEYVPASGDAWMVRFRLLKDAVARHVEREEGEVFQQIRGAFTHAELVTLAQAFEAARDRQLDRLSGQGAR